MGNSFFPSLNERFIFFIKLREEMKKKEKGKHAVNGCDLE